MEGPPHSSRMPEERRSTSHKEARRRVARSPMPGQKSGSARWLRGIKSARPERAAIELNFNGRTVAMPDPGYSDLLITRTGAPRSKIVPASIAASGSALPGHRLAETLPSCVAGAGCGCRSLDCRSGSQGSQHSCQQAPACTGQAHQSDHGRDHK